MVGSEGSYQSFGYGSRYGHIRLPWEDPQILNYSTKDSGLPSLGHFIQHLDNLRHKGNKNQAKVSMVVGGT